MSSALRGPRTSDEQLAVRTPAKVLGFQPYLRFPGQPNRPGVLLHTSRNALICLFSADWNFDGWVKSASTSFGAHPPRPAIHHPILRAMRQSKDTKNQGNWSTKGARRIQMETSEANYPNGISKTFPLPALSVKAFSLHDIKSCASHN